MAKRKKTLKQKLLADSRRKSLISSTSETNEKVEISAPQETKYVLRQTSLSSIIPEAGHKDQPARTGNILTASYQYLRSDLQRTVFLTMFILVAELAIKFLTKV